MSTTAQHNCDAELVKLEALRAKRNEITPNEIKAKVREIHLCPLCWQRLRNVAPRTIARIEAEEALRQNQAVRSAATERLEEMNGEATANAEVRHVNWNPGVGESVSRTERKRPAESEWLTGAAKTFPTLKGSGD